MDTPLNTEERLWEFIDGTCNAEEKSAIEKLIESNLVWRQKYQELLEVHQLMSSSLELDEPSMRFTRNVMDEIALHQIAPAVKSYIDKRIVRGIGIFFGLTLLGMLVYVFGQMAGTGSGSSHSRYSIPVDFSKLDFGKLDFSKVFNSTAATVFMMVNVILGLVLLDAYLNKKKKKLEEKHPAH